jgi:hypothetical protein
MIGLLCFVVAVLASPFKSKIRLEAENATLRHQLVVLRRKLKGRACLTNNDRWFFLQLYRWFPSILPVVMIIRPETLVVCTENLIRVDEVRESPKLANDRATLFCSGRHGLAVQVEGSA